MIRYPGSKAKIADRIIAQFPACVIDPLFQAERMEYREPFLGGGAIALRVLRCLPASASVWLNDKDFGLVCFWKAILDAPDELIEHIKAFRPTVEAFHEFKEFDGTTDRDPVLTGFRKFALHQLSFSGNGAMAGGPIGGKQQRSEFNVGCRWAPTRHARDVRRNNRLFRRFASVRITTRDFTDLTNDAPPHAFIYADPPYFKAGPQLYKYAFSEIDHRRLSESLRRCRARWVLSYDDHEAIRSLYPWAQIRSVELTYTTAVAKGRRRKNSELLISPAESVREAA